MSDENDGRRDGRRLTGAEPGKAGQAGGEFQVRRARRTDVPAIVAIVAGATQGKQTVDEAEVMDWLFGTGLVVAVTGGQIVGAATWQAENLLSVTDRFYVSPGRGRAGASRSLLSSIEAEANVLMCEANVLVLPRGTARALRALLQRQGYELKVFKDLHRIWREVLGEYMADEPELLVKRLREKMVMVPI